MSMHKLLAHVAMRERCESRTNAMLAINLVQPEYTGLIDVECSIIFAATDSHTEEKVKAIAELLGDKMREFEADLRTINPAFVVNCEGQIAGVRAAFENGAHRAQFEADNAERLAEMRADVAARQGTMEA